MTATQGFTVCSQQYWSSSKGPISDLDCTKSVGFNSECFQVIRESCGDPAFGVSSKALPLEGPDSCRFTHSKVVIHMVFNTFLSMMFYDIIFFVSTLNFCRLQYLVELVKSAGEDFACLFFFTHKAWLGFESRDKKLRLKQSLRTRSW